MKKLGVIGLIILGIVSGIVAVVYMTQTAGNLPHFYPGYLAGSSHMHYKHGFAFIGLAVLFFLGAWMLSGQKEKTPKKSEKEDTEE
jgi:predicted permease